MPPVHVQLIEGPLPPATPWHVPGAGAILSFEGVVRPLEKEHELVALQYQAYEPMTSRKLHRSAKRTLDEHCLLGLCVQHSVGEVKVGQVSFRLRLGSKHRGEGIVAMDQFIDRMKRDVPLWKNPLWKSRVRVKEI